MTAAQWAVLYVLASGERMQKAAIKERVRETDLNIGIETKNPFSPLESMELIERRYGSYQITDKGRSALRRLHRQAIKAMQELNG